MIKQGNPESRDVEKGSQLTRIRRWRGVTFVRVDGDAHAVSALKLQPVRGGEAGESLEVVGACRSPDLVDVMQSRPSARAQSKLLERGQFRLPVLTRRRTPDVRCRPTCGEGEKPAGRDMGGELGAMAGWLSVLATAARLPTDAVCSAGPALGPPG